MALSGILLGLINIGIVIVILVLIGAITVWVLGMLEWPVPWNIQRLYLAVVALIALYMLVALLFGLPTVHIISGIHTGATDSPFQVAMPRGQRLLSSRWVA
jgi:hypothetical protein